MKKNVLQIIYERWSKNSKEKTIDKTQINPGLLKQQLKKYYINKYKLFMQDGPRGGTINGKTDTGYDMKQPKKYNKNRKPIKNFKNCS